MGPYPKGWGSLLVLEAVPMASLFCVSKVDIHKFWNAINSSIFERRTFALGAISDKYKPGRKIARWTLRLPSVF